MTVRELYRFFEQKIPRALSCDWDNDGLMVCPDDTKEVRRVLVALDITAAVAEHAIKEGYDLVVSHHPLIFHPLKAVAPGEATVNKVIRLLTSGVSAMSFHTRLDAASMTFLQMPSACRISFPLVETVRKWDASVILLLLCPCASLPSL